MGATIPRGRIAAEAQVRGAAGDTLVWVDASGPVRVEPVPGDDWRDRLRRRPAALPARRDRRRRQPRRHPRRLPPRGGRPPAPRGPDARPTSPPTRSAAPSPIPSTSRPDPCSSATHPAPGASTTPTATASAPRPTSTSSPPPATARTELGPFGFLPTDPSAPRRRPRRPRPHAPRRRPRPHLRRSRRRAGADRHPARDRRAPRAPRTRRSIVVMDESAWYPPDGPRELDAAGWRRMTALLGEAHAMLAERLRRARSASTPTSAPPSRYEAADRPPARRHRRSTSASTPATTPSGTRTRSPTCTGSGTASPTCT